MGRREGNIKGKSYEKRKRTGIDREKKKRKRMDRYTRQEKKGKKATVPLS